MANLLLDLKLDNLVNEKLLDSLTGADSGAEVAGASVVIDDKFGSVLSFDGVKDYLKLPFISGIKAISIWVNLSTPAEDHTAFLLDAGPDLPSFMINNKGLKGEWQNSYVNGEKADLSRENIPDNKWIYLYLETESSFDSAITFMARNNLSDFAKGKISHLRLFSEALNPTQIKALIRGDLSVMNTYRARLPIDFNMWNERQEKALFITNDGSGTSMMAEIRNTSSTNIQLKGNSATPDKDHYHFSLHFRPGVLQFPAEGEFPADAIKIQKDWKIISEGYSNKSVKVWIVSEKDLSIPSGESHELQISDLKADRRYGSRGTQVQLQYQGLSYAGNDTPLKGTQVAYMDIVSHAGKPSIPLHVGFIGSNTVLNDGITENELTLRITNTGEDAIKSQTDGTAGDKDSQFTFTFKGPSDSQDSVITSIVGIVMMSGVKNLGPEGGQAADGTWIYELTDDLEPGAHIDVEITELVCDQPSGISNLYMKYEDIPGYWDGQFVLAIQKSPLVFRGKKVGIGTDEPGDYLLNINGPLKTGDIHAQKGTFSGNVGIGQSNPHNKLDLGGDGGQKLAVYQNGEGTDFYGLGISSSALEIHTASRSADAAPKMVVKASGNVGIGQSNPHHKLDLGGGVGKKLAVYQNAAGNDFYGLGNSDGILELHAGSKTREAPPVMVVKHTGHVGIGTKTPYHKLDLGGGGGKKLAVYQNAQGTDFYGLGISSGSLDIHAGSTINETPKVVVKYTGNLGIGTTSPEAPLSIGSSAGKERSPNTSMHITNDCILFGGNNNRKQTDSAQISAGLHQGNSLCIVGMGTKGSNRKITMWHEGGLRLNGCVGIKTAPNNTYVLDVKGHIRAQGAVYLSSVKVWDGTDNNDLTWNGSKITREGSSRRYKKYISPLKDDFSNILKVVPKKFQMRKEYGTPDNWTFGYIAEELDQLGVKNLVVYDEKGRPDGVKYKKLAMYVLEVVKENTKTISNLQERIVSLEEKLKTLPL